MLRNLIEYHWAEHLDEALVLLARLDTKTVPLAGGTYLLGVNDESIQAVVDLRELGLAYIHEDRQGVHIGAMTTLQQMSEHPLLQQMAAGVLAQAAQASSSSRLVRNCATIGGTLGAWIGSQADLLVALIAMNAYTVVRSGSKTQVNLSGGTAERPGLALAGVTFKGKQERRISASAFAVERRPNELMMEVIIPPLSPPYGTSFLRIGRTPTDCALLNVVALVEVGQEAYRRASIALGGVNMEPVRLTAIEKHLEGQPLTYLAESQRAQVLLSAVMDEFRPPADALVSSGYRRIAGAQLVYRALQEATHRACAYRASLPLGGKIEIGASGQGEKGR